MNTTATVNRFDESDTLAHIEDTRLFWTTRQGRPVRQSWNEMTATEKQQQREAEARAAYRAEFDIYGGAA